MCGAENIINQKRYNKMYSIISVLKRLIGKPRRDESLMGEIELYISKSIGVNGKCFNCIRFGWIFLK